MEITVKTLETEEEIKGKAYVHYTAWQEAYEGIVDRSFLDRLSVEKCEEIARKFRTDNLVAVDGDRVVGFAAYGKARDEDLENTGEVSAIYILADYYSKGVGYRLMQEALSRLSEYPQVEVWVLKDNVRAISFYKKCGFEFDGKEQALELGKPVAEVRMIYKRGGV